LDNATIYALANWLKALGLKLAVVVAETEELSEENSVGGVEELAEVSKG
jgi:hypothetical protein